VHCKHFGSEKTSATVLELERLRLKQRCLPMQRQENRSYVDDARTDALLSMSSRRCDGRKQTAVDRNEPYKIVDMSPHVGWSR
jgi:hypothetical protein